MTPSLNRAGGFASLLAGALYIVGFALFILAVDGAGYEGAAGQLAYARDNAAALTFAMIALYLVYGVALVILSGALSEQFTQTATGWDRITSGLGISWAVLVFASGMVGLVGLSFVIDVPAELSEQAPVIWTTLGPCSGRFGRRH